MEEAMRRCADKFDFVVRWKPFLLRPGTPLEGIPKGPTSSDGKQRLQNAGKQVGIDFSFKCPNYPNTLPSHALLEYAASCDGGVKQNDLQEAIFKAYFTDGIYPDAKALTKIAKEVGLNEKAAHGIVTDQNKLEQANEQARNWTRKGVTGVPCFFVNDQRTFSGAQDPEAFIKVFNTVAEKFPLEKVSSSQ